MSAHALSALGTYTEARFEGVFSRKALATAQDAQIILGLDDRTFNALVKGGAIQYVLIGRETKRYTEADLRAYLNRATELQPCPSTSRRAAASGSSISNTKGRGFTDRPAKLRVVQPSR